LLFINSFDFERKGAPMPPLFVVLIVPLDAELMRIIAAVLAPSTESAVYMPVVAASALGDEEPDELRSAPTGLNKTPPLLKLIGES
jgi:hypothetical protein